MKMGSSELERLWDVLPSDRRGADLLVNNVDRSYIPDLTDSIRQVYTSSFMIAHMITCVSHVLNDDMMP